MRWAEGHTLSLTGRIRDSRRLYHATYELSTCVTTPPPPQCMCTSVQVPEDARRGCPLLEEELELQGVVSDDPIWVLGTELHVVFCKGITGF